MSFTVLIVDDEETFRRNAEDFLSARGYETRGVGTLAEARSCLLRSDCDVVLLDGYGPNLLYETANLPVRPPIILITAYGDIEMAVDAMKNGAHDFLAKPIQFSQLEKSLERACEIVSMRRELTHLRETQKRGGTSIIGENTTLQGVLSQAHRAASASVSVLVTGETGTGKEVLAKFIHQSGPRSNKAFIAINC